MVGGLGTSLGHGEVWIGVPVQCYMECDILAQSINACYWECRNKIACEIPANMTLDKPSNKGNTPATANPNSGNKNLPNCYTPCNTGTLTHMSPRPKLILKSATPYPTLPQTLVPFSELCISTLPDPPCSMPLSSYPDRGFVIPSQAYPFPRHAHDPA